MDTPSIINVADARAHARPCRAITIEFDPEDERWPDTGMNIQIMQPGQPNRGYRVQADFLVLPGECIAIVEGEERRRQAVDSAPGRPGYCTRVGR